MSSILTEKSLMLLKYLQVKFGTPLNQKFGKNLIARDLRVDGGYKPGTSLTLSTLIIIFLLVLI
jgi:hypothetical protein